jgi:hypothetical protein
MGKLILLYTNQDVNDRLWAAQFVAANDEVKVEKAAKGLVVLDRAKQEVTKKPDWAKMLKGLEDAATASSPDGVVLLLGGHSGALCHGQAHCSEEDEKVGSIWFDPDQTLAFDQRVAFYDVLEPFNKKTPQEKDRDTVNDPAKKNTQEAKNAQERLDLRKTYDAVGKILRDASLRRFVFLSCAVGSATKFVDKVSKDWGVQLGTYKKSVSLQLDTYTEPGKKPVQTVWLFLEGNSPSTDGEKTYARKYIPPLLHSSDAYLAGGPAAP